MERKYLVYKITNRFDGKIYIGCHSTKNKNDRYMGSGTEIRKALKKYGRKSFVKEILFEFDTKEEMLTKEKELVTKEFCLRQDTYNVIEGGGFYTSEGMVVVKDKEGIIYKIYSEDPRYLSGELVGIAKGIPYNKGKFSVKDKEGNTFQVGKDDPRYLSGELVHTSTGLPGTKSFEGKSHKDDTKQKMSEKAKQRTGDKNSSFGTMWITKESENKKIKKEEYEVYLNQGWNKGRKIIGDN
jgi:hypothetical protein